MHASAVPFIHHMQLDAHIYFLTEMERSDPIKSSLSIQFYTMLQKTGTYCIHVARTRYSAI